MAGKSNTDKAVNKVRSTQAQSLLDSVMAALAASLSRTACEECGQRPTSPTDISNAMKFLKDNGFVIDPADEGDALDDLLGAMNKKAAATYPTTEATDLN